MPFAFLEMIVVQQVFADNLIKRQLFVSAYIKSFNNKVTDDLYGTCPEKYY